MRGRAIWTMRGGNRSRPWRVSGACASDNYELLKELPEAAFERRGIHSERGPQTLRHLLEYFADHAESHARQMQAIREEYKKQKGKK